MSRTPTRLVIECTSDHVRAVVQRGGRIVSSGTRAIDAEPASALRDLVQELGVRGAQVIVGVARTETVLKTIALPEAGLEAHETPAFVRLQMDRQLPFSVEQARIDFVHAPHDTPGLLAGAIREDAYQRSLAIVKGAGLSTPVVALIDEGLSRLLGAAAPDEEGVLGVFVSAGLCEIVVARRGRLLTSRACELSDDAASAIETVVTEARRTLMSYRVRPDACAVVSGALLAPEDQEPALRGALEQALDLGRLIDLGASVVQGSDPARARLAGLFGLGTDALDFAHPTRAPDRGARSRQLAMLALLAVIVLMGGWLTLGLRAKRALEAEVDLVETEASSRYRDAVEALRTAGRLEHARTWLDAQADWAAHLALIAGEIPGGDAMLLDRIDLASDLAVDYDNKGSRVYKRDRWSSGVGVGITLSGRVTTTDMARSTRDAFVGLEPYRLTPIGEDAGATGGGRYPVPIAFSLDSRERAPAIGSEDEDG